MKLLRSFLADLALLPEILRQAAAGVRHRRALQERLAAAEAERGRKAIEAMYRADQERFGIRPWRSGYDTFAVSDVPEARL